MEETFAYCCDFVEWFQDIQNLKFADFYFAYQCSKVNANDCAHVFRYLSEYYNCDSQIVYFLATRYLNSETFWKKIGVRMVLRGLLRFGFTDIVEKLPKAILERVSNWDWMSVAVKQTTDAILWWCLFEFQPSQLSMVVN